MFDTLSVIGNPLNNKNITWGISASLLLNSFRLITQPNDIDFSLILRIFLKQTKPLNIQVKRRVHISDDTSVTFIKNINGVDFSFTDLEVWCILYQLILNRHLKVQLMEKYLNLNSIQDKSLLDCALKGNLPNEAKDRIQSLFF